LTIKSTIDYGKLKVKIPVDLLKNIEKLNVIVIHFNDKFVYKNDTDICDQNIPFNQAGQIVLIKSQTGKTIYLKHIYEYYKNLGYSLVSITLRRALAKFHSSEFNIDNYLEITLHSYNEVL